MKIFKRYLYRPVEGQRVLDKETLSDWGIRVRYAPEEPEDFDEYEFGLDFRSVQDVGFLVTVEKGKIARMLFGWTVEDNPDMLRPMKDEDLKELLEKKGEILERFFDYITSKG